MLVLCFPSNPDHTTHNADTPCTAPAQVRRCIDSASSSNLQCKLQHGTVSAFSPFLCYLQGTQVLLSTSQTATCSEQPSSSFTAAVHSATPLCMSSSSAAHASRASLAPTAFTPGFQRHPTVSQSRPNAMLPLVQAASNSVLQEPHPTLHSMAGSQHTSGSSNAHAATEATHQASALPNANAVIRLSQAALTATSVDRAQDSHTHQPASLLPADAHQLITGAWKMQDTLRSPQLPPSSTHTLLSEPSPRGAPQEKLSASPPSRTESSATARSLPEPPARASLSVSSLCTEASATSPSGTRRHTPDTKEALLSQLSSIFGSPQASASEQVKDALVGATSDSTVSSPGSAHSRSIQPVPHQQSTAAPPSHACIAACTATCLLAFHENLLEPTHGVGIARVASPGPRTLSATLTSGVIERKFAQVPADVGSPPCALSALVSASGVADHGVTGSCASGRGCLLPIPSPTAVPLPAPLVSGAMDTISSQDAMSDESWEASRASVAQRRHSSSCR